MNLVSPNLSLLRGLQASAILAVLSLTSPLAEAQDSSAAARFHVYSWQCSRSFQPQRVPTDAQQALDAALALKLADENYFVEQTTSTPLDVMDAWSLVFGPRKENENLESIVYEKVDGEWKQLATFARREDAGRFVQDLAETDRVTIIAVRVADGQPNVDEPK